MKYLTTLIGPLSFFIILLTPFNLDPEAHRFLAIFVLTVALWFLSQIPLFVTGIMSVTLSVLMGVTTAKVAFAPFADPIIFLFLGGFLFGRALENTGLDQVFAIKILSHKQIQNRPQVMVAVFLGLIFVFSMWISNTATMVMFLPIGMGLLRHLGIKDPKGQSLFLISMAYSATAGGNVTPIGSPPNMVAIGLLSTVSGIQISFLHWMLIAGPFALITFIFVVKRLLKIMIFDISEVNFNASTFVPEYRKFDKRQNFLLIVFLSAVAFWILPGILAWMIPKDWALTKFLTQSLDASIVAMFFSLILFLFPIKEAKKILGAHDISTIDWSTLLLFGSGLSLGALLYQTGLADVFGAYLGALKQYMPMSLLFICIIGATIFFTELASNTASANILIPIVMALSKENAYTTAYLLPILIALGCNSAFMLPVATPPNAIAFGTGKVAKKDMIWQGLILNFVSWGLLALILFVFTGVYSE